MFDFIFKRYLKMLIRTIFRLYFSCYIIFSNIDGLLKEAAFINGKWIHSTKTFDVFNPFDGNLIAKVPNLGEVECEEAIDAAYEVKKILNNF